MENVAEDANDVSFVYEDSDAEENSSDEDSNENRTLINLPDHLLCAAHTLNLVATTDFNKLIKPIEIHFSALEKCSILWKASKWPKLAEIINDILKSPLRYPTVTRWNSLYDSVRDMMKRNQTDLRNVLRRINEEKKK